MEKIDDIEVCALCQAAIPEGQVYQADGKSICRSCSEVRGGVRPRPPQDRAEAWPSGPYQGTLVFCALIAIGLIAIGIGSIGAAVDAQSGWPIAWGLISAFGFVGLALLLGLARRILITLEAIMILLDQNRKV